MHRHVREHLEEVLADRSKTASEHLADCRECGAEVNAMREQAALLRELRAPEASVEPRPGFYARVMERIETEGPGSIWSMFFDSTIGRRLAFASVVVAALLVVTLISWERFFPDSADVAQSAQPFTELRGQVVVGGVVPGEDQPGVVVTGAADSAPDDDSVLVNLVTYREQ